MAIFGHPEAMQLVVQEDEEIIALNKLEDFDKLISLFKDYGGTIAGVVTEFPTNPLMQSFDIEVLHQTCQKHQAILIIDPTMVSRKMPKFPVLQMLLLTVSQSMLTGKVM